MTKKLTPLEAFRTVIKFLDNYYERTPSDDLGLLLGEMQLQNDDQPADSAAWSDWINSVNKVKHNQQNELTSLEAFKAMSHFLLIYQDQIESNDIKIILTALQYSSDKIINQAVEHEWHESVDYILSNKNPTYGYFQIFK